MSDIASQQAAPGWYPHSPGEQRYWDGSKWTEHVAPLVAQPQVVTVAQPYKTNHALHIVLSIFTAGLWIPVWLIVTAYNSAQARKPH